MPVEAPRTAPNTPDLQNALKAFRDQVQNAPAAGAEGRYTVDCRPIREAAANALRQSAAMLQPIRSMLDALYPGASSFLPSTVDGAIKFLNAPFPLPAPHQPDSLRLTTAARDTLLKTLNTLSLSPQATPQVQTRVKETIAKLNTELDTLRRQVAQRAQLLQQGDAKAKANAEALGKNIVEQRTKVTGAFVAIQQASPGSNNTEILRTIYNNLIDADTPEQITKVIEQQAESIDKALTGLAIEVGGTYQPGPNAAIQRRTGTIIVGVHRAVDALYRNERSAKFLRETLGMTPEDLKDTVTGWLAELFESMPVAADGILARSLEGATRGVAEEIRFRQALTNYRGNSADVTDVWRQDWSKRYRAWLAQPAQSRGPLPVIQNPELSAKQEQVEKAEKDKKAQETKAKEDEQKAQKDAATDLATTRRIEETDIPGNGLLIPTAPAMTTINIPGNRTVFFQRSAGGDFRMRVEVGAAHDNWITIRTTSMRPNAARLCAPVGTQSLADLRLVTQTPDGRPAFWKRTAPLTLRAIVEQIEKRGVQSPLTLVLADDNSLARLLSPEEAKKESESKSKIEAQAKGKAETLLKTAGETALKQIESLVKVLGLPESDVRALLQSGGKMLASGIPIEQLMKLFGSAARSPSGPQPSVKANIDGVQGTAKAAAGDVKLAGQAKGEREEAVKKAAESPLKTMTAAVEQAMKSGQIAEGVNTTVDLLLDGTPCTLRGQQLRVNGRIVNITTPGPFGQITLTPRAFIRSGTALSLQVNVPVWGMGVREANLTPAELAGAILTLRNGGTIQRTVEGRVVTMRT